MLFEVQGLSKRFGELAALSDVGFQVRAGEVLGLIGPNGAGKSTLLECPAGVLPCGSSGMRVHGRSLRSGERPTILFYVPDSIAPWSAQPLRWLGGSRVFPPFQGDGGGPSGGPLMTLLGRKIDMFFHPTAVRPGSVLVAGDTFALAGAVAPTLPGLVIYTVTAPSGKAVSFSGRANKVGYYYHPADDFVVTEPGIYTVDLKVLYDGVTSAGQVTQPFLSGGILG